MPPLTLRSCTALAALTLARGVPTSLPAHSGAAARNAPQTPTARISITDSTLAFEGVERPMPPRLAQSESASTRTPTIRSAWSA